LVLDASDAESACYGLGTEFTFDQFQDQTGVFIASQKIFKRARFGLSSQYQGTEEATLKGT
jgi:hypothetical protein